MKSTASVRVRWAVSGLVAASLTGGVLLSPASTPRAHAQAQPPAPDRSLPLISLDLRDAPIRQALEQLFNKAKVDFSIANEVQGFVTLKITDQPFENALRLILRSSSVPLTWVGGGVYFVKPRVLDSGSITSDPAPQIEPTVTAIPAPMYDQIQLTYIDPADLASVLGITFIHTFTRQTGQQGGQGQNGQGAGIGLGSGGTTLGGGAGLGLGGGIGAGALSGGGTGLGVGTFGGGRGF